MSNKGEMGHIDPKPPGEAAAPPVSSYSGPIADLITQRVLAPPARPGLLAVLGRYEILRMVGAGGMGIVLLARDIESTSRVAIKLVKPELLADERVRHRFAREAGHMQRLKHRNIVPVLEIAEASEGPYFVMPYFDRGNLSRQIVPGKPMSAEHIADIALQIAAGLDYAHRRGIIHRDLKPGNILLGSDGTACLTDFGLARTLFNDTIVDPGKEECEGTAPYMSPGVADGQAEDTRCDIYAFGALLYEMLAGRPAYEGHTTWEVRRQILAGPPMSILSVNPNADRNLAFIAAGAMGRRLRDRYSTMADIVADLQRLQSGKPPLGPSGARRRALGALPVPWKALGLAVAAALAAAVAWRSWPARPAARSAAIVSQDGTAEAHPALEANVSFPPLHLAGLKAVAVSRSGELYLCGGDPVLLSIHDARGASLNVIAGQRNRFGGSDGAGPSERLSIPRFLAADANGRIYISDAYQVRRFTPETGLITLAGVLGQPGTADGPASVARFQSPSGIAIDARGNVYVADRYTIRRLSSTGRVDTVAGAIGHAGCADGDARTARFSDQEKGIAVRADGTLFVADGYNHVIRQISPAGLVTTLAGSTESGSRDGRGSAARFVRPIGIAIDPNGGLMLADAGDHTLRHVGWDGTVTTVAGKSGSPGRNDGDASQARFNQPRALAFAGTGTLYVADAGNGLLRRVARDGRVTTVQSEK